MKSQFNQKSDPEIHERPASLSEQAMQARKAFPRGLKQAPGSYRFGMDALLLGAYAAKTAGLIFKSSRRPIKLLESGCGCGAALLLSLLHVENSMGLGVDIDGANLACARQNAQLLAIGEATFLEHDLCEKKLAPTLQAWQGQCQVVLANPPWRHFSEKNRSASETRNLALWATEQTFSHFFRFAARMLMHGGQFCSIIHPDALGSLFQGLDDSRLGIRELLPVHAHSGKAAMRLLARAQLNSVHRPVFLPPLILYTGQKGLYGKPQWTNESKAFCPSLASGHEDLPETDTTRGAPELSDVD